MDTCAEATLRRWAGEDGVVLARECGGDLREFAEVAAYCAEEAIRDGDSPEAVAYYGRLAMVARLVAPRARARGVGMARKVHTRRRRSGCRGARAPGRPGRRSDDDDDLDAERGRA